MRQLDKNSVSRISARSFFIAIISAERSLEPYTLNGSPEIETNGNCFRNFCSLQKFSATISSEDFLNMKESITETLVSQEVTCIGAAVKLPQ